MSSVAVNCRSVAQKWTTIANMPSDVIYTITQPDHSTLVVEDNERAAKAAEGTGPAKEQSNAVPHINGGPVPRSFAHQQQRILAQHQNSLAQHQNSLAQHQNSLAQQQNGLAQHQSSLGQQARGRFTCPRVPHPPPLPPYQNHLPNGGASGDVVDTCAGVVKTKLRSFQETPRKEYYHDPTFLQSEVNTSHLGSSRGQMERDDEGEHHRDDHIHPRHPEIKEGSMFVHLPQSQKTLHTQAELQASVVDPLVNPESEKPREPPMETKPMNNNKVPEEVVESNCVVDCLYCCIQCSDCSIM